jgi:hypothetical protein
MALFWAAAGGADRAVSRQLTDPRGLTHAAGMAFDRTQWNENAAVTRCLLELMRRSHRRNFEPAQFVAARLQKYPHWATQPGRADHLVCCELIRELGLAGSVRALLDPDQIMREAKQPGYAGALLFLERWPGAEDPRRLEVVEHCVLALEFDEKFFKVWNPFQDGTALESPWSWKSWSKLAMHGLVLAR